jgi:magnesium transporter
MGAYAEGMISYWAKANGGGPTPATHLGRDMWAQVVEPSDAELDALASEHGLERDLLADAIDPHEVPRVQEEKGVVYFFLRAPSGEGEQAQTIPVLVAIAPHFLITVAPRPFRWMEHFRASGAYNTSWRSQMVWRLMLALTSRYQSAVTSIARHIRGSFGAGISVTNEEILRLVAYEGVLNDFISALTPMQATLENVAAGRLIKVYPEDHDLMEDVRLAMNQVSEAAKAQLKTAVNFRDAYAVVATNNLNRIIKFLTLITVVLTVPMVMSGLFGMNVALPLEDRPDAFWLVVLITLGIVVVLLRVLKHKKLL